MGSGVLPNLWPFEDPFRPKPTPKAPNAEPSEVCCTGQDDLLDLGFGQDCFELVKSLGDSKGTLGSTREN